MKLSLNWIKRYVDLPADLTMDKLAYDLTMCTVEVEDATNIGESLAGPRRRKDSDGRQTSRRGQAARLHP